MSRLESHRQKNLYQRIYILAALLIIFIIFMYTVGLRLIIDGSLMLSGVNKNTKIIENVSSINNDFSNLLVDHPPTATNAASILLTGSVINFDQVEFYLNDEKIKDISPTDGNFSEIIDNLQKGDNQIFLVAKSSSDKRLKKSDVYEILYKNEKPKLEITQPIDQTKTSQQEIIISGKTNSETYIRINNRPVVVDSKNEFRSSEVLKEGENKFEIIAEDAVGNTETKQLTVIYQKEE